MIIIFVPCFCYLGSAQNVIAFRFFKRLFYTHLYYICQLSHSPSSYSLVSTLQLPIYPSIHPSARMMTMISKVLNEATLLTHLVCIKSHWDDSTVLIAAVSSVVSFSRCRICIFGACSINHINLCMLINGSFS